MTIRAGALGLSLCAALVGSAARPQTTDELQTTASIYDAGSGEPVPLFLSVTINGRDTELVAEFEGALDGSDMSSTRSELEQLGIRAPLGISKQVPLDSIEGLTWRYDERAQAIHISAPYSVLLPEVVSAARKPGFEPADASWGAAMNYSLVGEHGFGDAYAKADGTIFASLDGWIFAPFGQLGSTGIYSRPMSGDGPETAIRLETALKMDLPDKALTLTFGDFTTSGPTWHRPVRLGGVELRRNFDLRSDLVTDQRLSFDGSAAVPSSVDVFIENNRVFSTRISDGPFRLEDLPIQGGGDAQILVRGADGQVRRETVSFFAAPSLLKQGMADYSLAIGQPREGFGLTSDDYGDPTVLTSSLRYGLTKQVTVEAHVSATEELQLWGAGLTAVPFSLAEVSVAAAQSRFAGETGEFLQLGLRTQIGKIDLNASTSRTGEGFADLAYVTGLDYLGGTLASSGSLLEVAERQDVISLGIPILKSGRRLGLSYVRAERENSSDQLASVSFGAPLAGGRGSFSVNSAYNFETDDTRVSFGLSWKLGKRTYAQASAYTDLRGEATQDLSVSRTMGEGLGAWGYQVQAARKEDGRTPLRARGDLRARYGEMAVEVQSDSGSTYMRGQLDGAVAFTGGALAFGNHIRDGFAVIDVGVEDVPVYLDNRPVARSNARGRVLVNGLNAYRRNRVSVNVRDLPEQATLGVSAIDVVPSRRSGQYLSFGGSQGGGVLVVLRDASGRVLPAGTVVYANGSGTETYVGYDGETWIEDARPRNTLKVELASGGCTAHFAHDDAGALQDLIDPVTCR